MTTLARAALAAHHIKADELSIAIEAARRPVLELADKIDAAKADFRAAEAAMETAHRIEAAAIIENGHDCTPANLVRDVAKTTAAVERQKRVVAALEARKNEVQRPLQDAELSASIHLSGLDALLAGVLAEDADAVIADMAECHAAAARSEARCRTLLKHISNRKWYVIAERLNAKLHSLRLATWGEQSFPDWQRYTEVLADDPQALAPAVAS